MNFAKLGLTSFQKTTISICFNLLQVSPPLPPFTFAMIFIPSSHVLSSYFCVSLSLVEVITVSILINFTTQSSITKNNRKKEGKKTLSNLFFLLIQLHDRRFILFFRFSFWHLCCVWLLTASSLSFFLFSFLFMFFFFIWFIFAVLAFRFFRFSFLEKD